MPPDALVFDLDGTIVDTEAPEFEATRVVWADHGLELTMEHWQQFIGTARFDWVADLERAAGTQVDRAAAERTRRHVHAELIEHQGARPGVVELMVAAGLAGLPVAVASNAPEAWVVHHLDRLGLDRHVSAVRAIEHVVRGKPWPDVYLAACAAVGALPEHSVAFEDSITGVTAAKAAGLFTVAAPHALSALHDLSAADLLVVSLAAVSLETLAVQWPS